MKPVLVSYVSGIIFALGLGIGGMTQPAKVVAFLDFAGKWDASLAMVMVGAIGVHAVFYRRTRKRSTPLFAPSFSLPTRADIDGRLLIGAAVFGVGWGIAGYCPGPALTSGDWRPLVLSLAMIAGMAIYEILSVLRPRG